MRLENAQYGTGDARIARPLGPVSLVLVKRHLAFEICSNVLF